MTKEQKNEKVLTSEERFFLNLDQEDLSLEVPIHNFTFKLRIPTMSEESRLSLSSITMVRTALSRPEYAELVNSIKIPTLEQGENVEGQEQVEGETSKKKVAFRDPDITKMRDLRFVMRHLPEEFIITINNIAYLNIVVSDIGYGDKELWVTKNGKETRINTFQKFCDHVTRRNLRLGTVIDRLLNEYQDWVGELEVSPDEVKN